MTPWAQFCWGPRGTMGPKSSPTWPGPIEGVQDHQDPGLRKVAGEDLVMSSKLTELTEYSPSAPPPSVLCGSGIFSKLSSPSMASSGRFDPTKPMIGTEQLKFFILPLLNFWPRRDVARWTSVGGPIPVCGRPIYSSSEVSISRINTEGVVKRIRRIDDSPTDPDAEGSDELDGEEVVVVPHSVGHPSRNSSAQPLAKRFQSQLIPGIPRTFQPVLASIPTTIPPSSPSTSHARPALNPELRPSPSQQTRNLPITTSQQLQPVASSSRRRDGLSPLLFPAAQVFQRRYCWPIQVTREDPNAVSENKEAVARLFRRVDRNSREVIMYANDKTIPRTSPEEMVAKFSWYEDELINDFQRTFDDFSRDK
ncbi:hypothetical protein O181_044265 [Austropuccinia psidii MF-1]|uniref:Uncharacterized protein n=1 Tax=Austropuccinia psidii MF-1 TaxID=1389203 RepID=A0A9Q3HK03_9BASI|nr:hypothetical protein [Austropuccinia psidii MF-1]